ncbi:MAG: polysaccharide deacetylase [Candidatus Marinimicrobia bacterium]|nr:polysaccharide deacetylase [Candidatus Neomarinimicrobiota bacterium]|tara:strand:+ start:623 stop:1573 length:951 start_codon:yes stop_codon:yes gene_type:complete
MKAITYHYVREENIDFPGIIYLHSKNFIKQLDFFDKNYGISSKDSFFKDIENQNVTSEKIILTFDDGLSDHYNFVFPHLVLKKHWGIFYVSIGPYLNEQLLDVHRIHIILARFGGERALLELKKILEPNMIDQEKVEEFEESVYKLQGSTNSFLEFKKILNYYVSFDWKPFLLRRLIRSIFSINEERKFAKEFYLTIDQIKKMHKSGMTIGAHSINHHVMSSLEYDDQKREVEDACDFLSNCLGDKICTFAYPYGTKKTYTDEISKIIENQGIDFTFAIEDRDISNDDLKNNIYSLPRYDCNQFKFGKNELPDELS